MEIYETRKEFLKSKGLLEHVTIRESISDLERKHGETRSKKSPLFTEGVYGKPENSYQKLMRSQETKSLPDSHRFPRHRKATVERFRFILENCPKNISLSQEYKDKLGLKKRNTTPLSGDHEAVCPVLTTLPDDYIHYSEPRILTVREYARIQSFPDWYEFKSKYTTGGSRRKIQVPRYTQIGNALPPLFAELTGVVLLAQLRRNAHNSMASNDVNIVEPCLQ
jgi:DNA (cytosine-5)-methyltransferase 1